MRVALLASAVAGALAGVSRHIRLDSNDAAEPGVVRFLTGLHVTLEEGGKKTRWVTLTRTGNFHDPRYGEFSITREMLLQMVENFDKRVLGVDVFIDVSHQPSNGAAAKILKLAVEGDRLRAEVEFTPYGIEAVKNKGYQYLSAEYHEDWQDNEQRKRHGCVLLGAGLTVRPVIKRLDPVMLSEPDGTPPTLLHPELKTILLSEIQTMWKDLIEALKRKLKALAIADAVADQLVATAEKALANVTDKPIAEALIGSFETAGKQLAEQVGGREVRLAIEVPSITTGLSADDVKKLLAEENKRLAEAQAASAGALAAKVQLLSDTIGAAQGLPDEVKKELTAAVSDLVTVDMSDEQIKKFAATQIASGHRLVAAQQLAARGFQPFVAGRPYITVDSSNVIKSLQESVDKRLGIAGMSPAQRFERTGGQLQEVNKQYVEKVLAEFDAVHGARLHAEHRQLAGGDSVVSDVAVPAIFERTVIREALYDLVGLQFVDLGTEQFAAIAQIPYSYRDTAAAGRAQARRYEGQSVARAAVKQAMEEARPTPQKLAFEVSDELRYLAGNGVINFDIVAENSRNAARIIGEDTEALIFNEILNASDQFSVTAVVNEAVANGDGTKSVFPLNNFPVVRPKRVYDLQGVQVGATQYPHTVTVNAVAINEYDFTNTQGAGTYYYIDYNLGELRFVNQLGVPVNITNTHAIVCSYSYTTNVFKFDTDLGALEVDAKWDDFLYRYGLRKAVIEDERFYQANYGLMSGTVRTMIERARQFSANYSRPGTNLSAEGNLGVIKGVPNFKTTAPGLAMGDQRIVIGQRNVTRFRMMKPWSMGQLENQKDAQGRFTGKKEAYGDQFVVVHTPTQLRAATTSIVLYSSSARIDRAA